MDEDKNQEYTTCPNPKCTPSGHVWMMKNGIPFIGICPTCKGTHRVPLHETDRDRMTKAFYTGDNT